MKIKFPYGTTAENNALTLPIGQLSVDLTKKALRFHDGVTPGGFEAVGVQAYTPDIGENWTNVGSAGSTSEHLTEIGGVFYSYSSSGNGAIRQATDLTAWTNKLAYASAVNFQRMKRVQDYVIAAWFNTTSGGSLFTRWINAAGTLSATISLPSSGNPEDADFAYFNGLYVVSSRGSRIHTAADPVAGAWTTQLSISALFIKLMTTPDYLYAFTSIGVYRSSDAVTWTLLTSNKPASTFTATDLIDYRDGVFIASVHTASTTFIYTSTDAINWTLRHTSAADGTVVHNGGIANLSTNILVLGYLNTVLSSKDGITWDYMNTDWGVTTDFLVSSMVHSTTGKLYALSNGGTIYRAD